MLIFLLFLLGLTTGSFLNVCIYRLPRSESLLVPRSHCTVCQHPLAPFDLIPILSYFLLKGRCRYCGQPYSARYALIELTTGLLFVWSYYIVGWQWELLLTCSLAAMLIVIIFIDFDHQLILDKVNLTLAVLGLVGQLFIWQHPWLQVGYSLLAGGGLLLAILLLSRGGMGDGDVKMAAALAFWFTWPQMLLMLFMAFVSGGLIGLFLLATGRRSRHDGIPFGPFLAVGTWITWLYGNQILRWYVSTCY